MIQHYLFVNFPGVHGAASCKQRAMIRIWGGAYIPSRLSGASGIVRMGRRLLVRVGFYLLWFGCCRHPGWRNIRHGAAFAQSVLFNIKSGDGGREMESNRNSSGREFPRLLTLLTTYHKRTVFSKANREAMEQRADGYESLVSTIV